MRKVNELKREGLNIDRADEATMQTYHWRDQYDGIFLTWCAGYVNDKELYWFLRRAKLHLRGSRTRGTLKESNQGFNFVLDSVAMPGEIVTEEKGQRVRTKDSL